jgi:3-deoxy-manno-octulosonate cytidylyltransferase (CMP-KDO synthetase)
MASLIAPITDLEEFNDPNVVKAVIDNEGFALYFSRSPIPYERQTGHEANRTTGPQVPKSSFRHLGIYSYTREALLKFNLLPQSLLEQTEKLEQLRALENGIKIKLEIIPKAYPAVDIPEDVRLVEDVLKNSKVL